MVIDCIRWPVVDERMVSCQREPERLTENTNGMFPMPPYPVQLTAFLSILRRPHQLRLPSPTWPVPPFPLLPPLPHASPPPLSPPSSLPALPPPPHPSLATLNALCIPSNRILSPTTIPLAKSRIALLPIRSCISLQPASSPATVCCAYLSSLHRASASPSLRRAFSSRSSFCRCRVSSSTGRLSPSGQRDERLSEL